MNTAERIYQEAQRLPENLAQEVLDFITFLEQRHALRRDEEMNALQQAQGPVMERVWDNSEDEVWNDL